MTWTAEFEISKKIILTGLKCEDEFEVEDLIIDLIESGEIYKKEEFINSLEENYEIVGIFEDE